MTVKPIELENIGPIENLTFHLKDYGVTVLSGPNGCGKSTTLSAVQKLAAGGGRIPLRDGEKRGFIEGCGARLSIAAQARHTGEFDITHLEGRFDLAELVDPGMADPISADRRRIRALVTLTGAKPDVSLFREHKAFGGPDQFDRVADSGATGKHDLVDMAEAIKRCYETAARQKEDEAEQELGKAKALEEQAGEYDPNAETDEERLRKAYDDARDARAKLTVQQSDAGKAQAKRKEAQAKLEAAKASYQGPTVAAAEEHAGKCQEVYAKFDDQVAEFKRLLAEAEQGLKDAEHQCELASAGLQAAAAHENLVAQCQEIIDSQAVAPPSDDAVFEAEKQFLDAKQKQEYGTLARAAKAKLADALTHRDKAKKSSRSAEALRDAAGSIDEVLSSAIKSSVLRVESVDGKARLVVDHEVRGKTPFHELSDGEKWRVAIDLAADSLPENGIIVIEQHAWEGIDAFLRPQIHAHAKERKVFVLTAEATRDPADGRNLKAVPFKPAEAVGV